MKRVIRVLAFSVWLVFSGCVYDAQKELDTAFENADEIIVSVYYQGEEVSGVRFSYPDEEKQSLRSGLLSLDQHGSDCDEEAEGRIVFMQEEKEILEMKFLTLQECNSAWLTNGIKAYYFPLDTALSDLLHARSDLVKQLKGVPATGL